MLKQHQFYVYHQENRVYARRGKEEPVLLEACDTPQAAADLVQSIVNPTFVSERHPAFAGMGYVHPAFQAKISDNCRAAVETAYAAVGK